MREKRERERERREEREVYGSGVKKSRMQMVEMMTDARPSVKGAAIV